ncbi:MAG: AAA family ATPase [Alphaproteobacteria bacterium]|nr:AAA family ATPase [Alphaproteobacteria bacterium]
MLVFTENQAAFLDYSESSVVLGAPGSGKTLLLIEKAARLAQASKEADEVAFICFSYRSAQFVKKQFGQRYKKLLDKIKFGTVKDFAEEQLVKAENHPINFADNGKVRQLLRQVMKEERFGGSLDEAEHIIRSFRAQLKNPQETEPYVNLYNRYRGLLDQLNLLDRHMIVRQHIVGMDNGTVASCKVKYMLVDNVQDATPIQYRWLQTHLTRGVTLFLVGNDDLTAFGRDGAMGAEFFQKFEKKSNVKQFLLQDNYRTSKRLWPAVSKLPRLIKNRIPKKEKTTANHTGSLVVKECATQSEEITFLVEKLKHLKSKKVGIIVRQDEQAARLTHLLQVRGIEVGSYARPIWENQAAEAVLDLLYVMLNQAKDSQLFNVMSFMRVSTDIQAQLAQKGIQAKDWLVKGAQFPDGLEGSTRELSTFRRNLLSVWQLLQQRKIEPQEGFKAFVFDMLPHLAEDDRRFALLALDILLNIKGSMMEMLPNIRKETMPSIHSSITVAPVREVRNMEFDSVILPFAEAQDWPNQRYQALDTDEGSERRLFYLAVSRAKEDIIASYTDTQSIFLKEMQSSLKSHKG